MEFTHPLLETEIEAVSGHYMFLKEECLELEGERILHFVGYAMTDRSCCGPAGCGYTFVAGHVVSYRCGVSRDDRPVSLVEPVDEGFYQEIAAVVREKESLRQVHFLRRDGGSMVLF